MSFMTLLSWFALGLVINILTPMSFKLTCLNVRGVRTMVRRIAIFEELRNFEWDVCLLQECHIPHGEYGYLRANWRYGESYWSGSNTNTATGLGFLIKGPNVEVLSLEEIVPGRLAALRVVVSSTPLTVVNVYAPTTVVERVELLRQLGPLLSTSGPVIIGGDFNVSLDRLPLDSSARALKGLVQDFRLRDTGAGSNEVTRTDAAGTSRARLDYVLLTPNFGDPDLVLHAVAFSDHCLLSLGIELNGVRPRRSDLWKLNCRLLQDDSLVRSYVRKYREWETVRCLFPTSAAWWEEVKRRTMGFFRTAGRRRAAGKRERLKRMQAYLQRLHQKLCEGRGVSGKIRRVKGRIFSLLEARARAVIFRSKVQALEGNEKCTRFFFQ